MPENKLFAIAIVINALFMLGQFSFSNIGTLYRQCVRLSVCLSVWVTE